MIFKQSAAAYSNTEKQREMIQNTNMWGVILVGLDGDIGDLPIESGEDMSDAAVHRCWPPRRSVKCCNAANKTASSLLPACAGGAEVR